jgi:competence protein ComEC
LQPANAVRVPAALLALPLLAGASAGVLTLGFSPERFILATAAAAALCAVAGAGFLGEGEAWGVVVCVVMGCAAAGYSTGASCARSLLRPPLLQWFERTVSEGGDPVVVEGVLRADAALTGYGAVLVLDVSGVTGPASRTTRVQGGARLVVNGATMRDAVAQWRAGRTIRAPVLLRRPAVFSNPGVADERWAMALRGVILTGSIKSGALVEVTSRGSWLEERAASMRAWTRRTLDRHVATHDPRSGAVATAILVGDRTGLSDEDERRLQEAGTYHVIAISGGNIAILTALLIFGGRAMRVPHRTGAAVSVAILLFYGEVAGGAASVSRAIAAAVIFLTATIVDHRGSPLNVLAVAGLLAVGAGPETALDGGFQLSFGATAGIILGVPRIVNLVAARRGGRFARAARAIAAGSAGLAAATVCAEIALAPVGASLFSRITFAGLALNFAAIPLMTAVQCGSMALLLAAALDLPLAEALGRLVHHSAWALVESARLVELAPWLVRDVPPPALWLCVLYYSACLGLLVLPRARRLPLIALLAAGAMLIAGAGPAAGVVPRREPGVLRVVFLDVGQGDATAALLPDGRAILIDAGGLAGTTFDIGTRVVVPALRALGVRGLHALVLTHADPDHAHGAEVVLRRLGAANVWEGVPVPPHPLLRTLTDVAAAKRIVWRTVRPGDVERAGGVEVRVLHPPAPEWERQRVRNDDSVVIELRYGRVSLLLPGDIGREIEAELLPGFDPAPLVILKAAHHGSATSSSEAFIDAARPRGVIFSAGRNNHFGHPAKVVVERFARRGVEMFNTADDGAVFVETDGKVVDLYGWRTGRRISWK